MHPNDYGYLKGVKTFGGGMGMQETASKLCNSETCARKGELIQLNDFYKSKAGRLGRKAICKTCYHERFGGKMEKQRRRREYLIQQLPNTLTPAEKNVVYKRFNHACALTAESESVQMDHFVPLAWGKLPLSYGLGGTTFANMLPLDEKLNKSKGSANPFDWANTKIVNTEIDRDKWDETVVYMASKNGLTPWEFFNKVTSCHIHWRTKRLIKSLNKSLSVPSNKPYHLIAYLLKVGINVEVAVELFGNKKAKAFLKTEEAMEKLATLKSTL